MNSDKIHYISNEKNFQVHSQYHSSPYFNSIKYRSTPYIGNAIKRKYIYDALGIVSNEEDEFRQNPLHI
jgi:hypothetical protein